MPGRVVVGQYGFVVGQEVVKALLFDGLADAFALDFDVIEDVGVAFFENGLARSLVQRPPNGGRVDQKANRIDIKARIDRYVVHTPGFVAFFFQAARYGGAKIAQVLQGSFKYGNVGRDGLGTGKDGLFAEFFPEPGPQSILFGFAQQVIEAYFIRVPEQFLVGLGPGQGLQLLFQRPLFRRPKQWSRPS